MIYRVQLQALARTPRIGDDFLEICTFEAGYADVMAPHFDRLNEQSGQPLVFLNGATFGGAELRFLSRLIREVRAEISNYGDTWTVSLGWQLEPPHGARELFARVHKTRLMELLDQVDAAINEAKGSQTFVRFGFWGDE